MTTHGLKAFRDPASLAVVGASQNPAKWGYWLARGALAGKSRRSVYLVNASSPEILGEATYPRVSALPQVPELVAICVPGPAVAAVVDDALAAGAKAFLVIASGIPDEPALRRAIEAAGARLLGPNSLGLVDTASCLQLAWGNFTPGRLAIISQSGQLGSEMAILGQRAGIGISRFISLGNQLDLRAPQLLADLVDHEQTSIVALYMESFSDGRAIIGALRALRAAGKPALVLTTGASSGSRRLARSHTGSMTSAIESVDAACRAAGAIRVDTPAELINLARLLGAAGPPAGRRTALVSDSGGQGGIAADVAGRQSLECPVFSEPLQQRLRAILPAQAAVSNPVDLSGAGEANLDAYADVIKVLAASGEVDSVVLSGYFGCYAQDTASLLDRELAVARRLATESRRHGVTVLVHSMSVDSEVIDHLWRQGVPCYTGIEFALRSLALAAELEAGTGRDLHPQPMALRAPQPGYWAARTLLADLGVGLPVGLPVHTREQAAQAAQLLSYPLVLKAGWLEHKSEHDAVQLNLHSAAALLAAFDAMHARLGEGQYVIEEQDTRPHVVELLVGARRDADFGPMITVGAGGTEAELHRDFSVELAPVDAATAGQMISRLKCLPLLQGWRGKPAVDIAALAGIVAAVSQAIAGIEDISELEINPIRLAPGGALAVDALVLCERTVTV